MFIAEGMRTKYRREELVNAATYVLGEFAFGGAYDVTHVQRAAIHEWIVSRNIVVSNELWSAPVCRVVIRPYAQDMGVLSVTRISIYDSRQDLDDYVKMSEFNSQFVNNLPKLIITYAQEMSPADEVKAVQKAEANETRTTRGEPGRKRIEANEWARREVHNVGKEPWKVYPDWCIRYTTETGRRVDDLDDSKETFKKMLKRKPK